MNNVIPNMTKLFMYIHTFICKKSIFTLSGIEHYNIYYNIFPPRLTMFEWNIVEIITAVIIRPQYATTKSWDKIHKNTFCNKILYKYLVL